MVTLGEEKIFLPVTLSSDATKSSGAFIVCNYL